MLTKVGSMESAAVLPDTRAILRQIFVSLGVDSTYEIDVRRMAKRIGVTLPDLSSLCERLPDGRIRVKD